MKKYLIMIVAIVFLMNFSGISYADGPDITAEAAILIDADTGQVLFEKNSHLQLYPASTTKIMTGILALEKGNLDTVITVDDKTPYEISGTHIALEPGGMLTLRELLYSLLIESANDSAVVIAKHISGSVEEFAKLMNNKAKEVGALNTNFVNPNGLPNDEHVTTAYDLAMIGKYAMQNETFRSIVSNYTYVINPTNKKTEARYLKSSNRLLYSTEKILVDGKYVPIKYDGADGMKTGYTVVAQNCLVATAVKGDQRLISVVLKANGTNVYVDTHNLLNYGFNNFISKRIAFTNEFIKNITVEQGDIPFATAITGQTLSVVIPKGMEDSIERNIILPDKIKAPISKDQVLGKIEYSVNNKIIGTANIISASEVNQKPIYQAVDSKNNNFLLKKWWVWLIILLIAARLYLAYRKLMKKRKRRSFSYIR